MTRIVLLCAALSVLALGVMAGTWCLAGVGFFGAVVAVARMITGGKA